MKLKMNVQREDKVIQTTSGRIFEAVLQRYVNLIKPDK